MKVYKRLAGGRQRHHNHSNNLMMMSGGMKTISGMAEAGAKAGTIGRLRLGVTPSQRTTWNGDAKLFDDCTREDLILVITASLFLD